MSPLIKAQVKAIMQRSPALFNPIWERLYPVLRRGDGYVANDAADCKEAFTRIYRDNGWGSVESRSGWGSELGYTRVVRRHIERLVRRLDVRIFLDCPCGDFNWMRLVALPEHTSYIGGDIVEPLIEALQQRFRTERRRFLTLDIVEDPLPAADLWLCRDVLFHLPNADIAKVLHNFRRSSIGLMLTTTYDFPKRNVDVKPGGFRYINLRLPPFSLPPPILRLRDFVAPAPPRYLALWSRDQLAQLPGKGEG